MAVLAHVQRDALSDGALVARVRAGQRDCFATLVQRHRAVVRGVCGELLGRPAVVDDVMQEAAVEALVNIDSLRNPESFGPWLCGIALNICRRWLRHASRERIAGEMPGEIELVDDSPGPEQLVLAGELADLITAALRDLPPGQRAAAWLFYFRGYSIAETARTLQTTPTAIKARLHAARAALRTRLSPEIQEAPIMADTAEQLVRVEVVDVRAEAPSDTSPPRHVVVLREADGPRYLPIWIGPSEATQIAFATLGEPTPRPMTYAFMRSLLDAGGVHVREVRVTSLADHTFIAAVIVQSATPDDATVDARPSDAINIALEMSAPIYASAALLDQFAGSNAHGDCAAAQELPRTARDIVASAKEAQQQAYARIVEVTKQHSRDRQA